MQNFSAYKNVYQLYPFILIARTGDADQGKARVSSLVSKVNKTVQT